MDSKLKNLNRLIQALMYKHTDRTATPEDMPAGIFYNVPYIFQQHANLCTDASINMLYKACKKPIASMSRNPRGAFEGAVYEGLKDFKRELIILNYPREAPDEGIKRIQSEFTKVLNQNGPFVLDIGIRYGGRHSVLVTGISNDRILFNDPLTGANRTLTIGEICALHGSHSARFIEIAKQDFLSADKLALMRTSTLPEHVEIIKDQKYKAHFTLKKMENPCDALREFLQDIVKRGKCSDDERQKLSIFLDAHQATSNIVSLMSQLNQIFPSDDTTSEKLFKRLQSAIHYMNAPEEDTVIKAAVTNSDETELLLSPNRTLPEIGERPAASPGAALQSGIKYELQQARDTTAGNEETKELTTPPSSH